MNRKCRVTAALRLGNSSPLRYPVCPPLHTHWCAGGQQGLGFRLAGLGTKPWSSQALTLHRGHSTGLQFPPHTQRTNPSSGAMTS